MTDFGNTVTVTYFPVFLDNLYPEGAVPFFRLLKAWREQGDLDGIVMR